MYIVKEGALPHIIIIMATKLSSIFLCNLFLLQFHNGCNSYKIMGIVNHVRDNSRRSKLTEILKYNWNTNISKEINFK